MWGLRAPARCATAHLWAHGNGAQFLKLKAVRRTWAGQDLTAYLRLQLQMSIAFQRWQQNGQQCLELRQTKGQGQSFSRRYWHEIMGFNYRITNIAAAIGVAQFERLPQIMKRKQEIAQLYRKLLENLPVTFQRLDSNIQSSEWLVSVLLPEGIERERLMADLLTAGIETRPVFYCAHKMPMYAGGEHLPVAEKISARGISLPSFPGLTDDEIEHVAESLEAALRAQRLA